MTFRLFYIPASSHSQIYDLDFKNEGGGAAEMKKSVPQLIEYYKSWLSKYPFVSIEEIANLSNIQSSECFCGRILLIKMTGTPTKCL